jgi:hypothetical protein
LRGEDARKRAFALPRPGQAYGDTVPRISARSTGATGAAVTGAGVAAGALADAAAALVDAVVAGPSFNALRLRRIDGAVLPGFSLGTTEAIISRALPPRTKSQ